MLPLSSNEEMWLDRRLFPFSQMEEIEYSCEKCSGKSATVTHKFSKLPR